MVPHTATLDGSRHSSVLSHQVGRIDRRWFFLQIRIELHTEARDDPSQLPQLSPVHDRRHIACTRVMHPHRPIHELYLVRRARGDHSFHLFRIHCQRFLTEYVLSVFRCLDGPLMV